jgi:hypothetical protein
LVTIYYPWHALHGQTLTVFRREKQDRRELFFCELPNGRLVGIPQWMTDPASAAYSLGPPVIGVEALVALRELLAAVRGVGVADNRPFQEEGHETIRTASRLAVESASGRYACSTDSRATGTGAGLMELLIQVARQTTTTPNRFEQEGPNESAADL